MANGAHVWILSHATSGQATCTREVCVTITCQHAQDGAHVWVESEHTNTSVHSKRLSCVDNRLDEMRSFIMR
jgi:hypothetical protein